MFAILAYHISCSNVSCNIVIVANLSTKYDFCTANDAIRLFQAMIYGFRSLNMHSSAATAYFHSFIQHHPFSGMSIQRGKEEKKEEAVSFSQEKRTKVALRRTQKSLASNGIKRGGGGGWN